MHVIGRRGDVRDHDRRKLQITPVVDDTLTMEYSA
jgi:hypothetical protein